MRSRLAPSLPDLGTLGPIGVFFGVVVGAYGFGTWLGKTIALIRRWPVTATGDVLGSLAGSLGLLFFIGYVLGEAFK